MQDIYIPAVISFLHLQHHLSRDLHYCGRTHACVNFHAFISCYVRPVTRGGSRGSDEPPILTSFLLKPAVCINTQQ